VKSYPSHIPQIADPVDFMEEFYQTLKETKYSSTISAILEHPGEKFQIIFINQI